MNSLKGCESSEPQRKRMHPEKKSQKRKQLIRRDGNCCHYCGKKLLEQQMTLDHKVPWSLGGSDALENLVIACRSCNQAKGIMSYQDFKRQRKPRKHPCQNTLRENFFSPANLQPNLHHTFKLHRTTAMHKLLTFRDENLLRLALTHRSYVNENPSEMHNERLEFLGDAILNFLSGEYLYQQSPDMGEDEMTRRRAALVDEKQLAKFATQVGLDFRMRLGKGAIQEGGYQNPNLLSSTFEAVVGAYYLDKNRNIEAIRPLVEELFSSVPEERVIIRSNIDSKNQFQQWVQINISSIPPKYVTEKSGGTEHAPEFVARVFVAEKQYGEGKGKSKKEAEKQAAENALAKLRKRGLL